MSRSAAKSRADKSRPVAAPPPPAVQLAVGADVVAGRLTETDWLEMVAREEGEEVVARVVVELLEGVLDTCRDLDLQKQLVPFTVWRAREILVRTVEWRFVVRDEGEDPDSALLWMEDPEPQTSITDSWAEGCVPVVYMDQQEHTPLLQKLLDLNLEESKESINAEQPSRSSSQCEAVTPPSSLQARPSRPHPPTEPDLQSAKPTRKHKQHHIPLAFPSRTKGNTKKQQAQLNPLHNYSSQKPLQTFSTGPMIPVQVSEGQSLGVPVRYEKQIRQMNSDPQTLKRPTLKPRNCSELKTQTH